MVQFYCMEERIEAGGNILFCVPVGSPSATGPTPWLLQVDIPFPGGFLLLWFLF